MGQVLTTAVPLFVIFVIGGLLRFVPAHVAIQLREQSKSAGGCLCPWWTSGDDGQVISSRVHSRQAIAGRILLAREASVGFWC